MINFTSFFFSLRDKRRERIKKNNIKAYLQQGQIPWSKGYIDYREQLILRNLNDPKVNEMFISNEIKNFGKKIDERIIEYSWVFSKLSNKEVKILDAGSTFNYENIVNHPKIENKILTIFTYFPEPNCFYKKRISYCYGDLRDLPFRDGYFDEIVSMSTIEHIDMNNSRWGYDIPNQGSVDVKSYEYLKTIHEFTRVLSPQGKLLITVPFGKFKNYDYFQQFDYEMVQKAIEVLKKLGSIQVVFFKYEPEGWRYSSPEDLQETENFLPGVSGTVSLDGAAHSRGICCLEFIKH